MSQVNQPTDAQVQQYRELVEASFAHVHKDVVQEAFFRKLAADWNINVSNPADGEVLEKMSYDLLRKYLHEQSQPPQADPSLQKVAAEVSAMVGSDVGSGTDGDYVAQLHKYYTNKVATDASLLASTLVKTDYLVQESLASRQ